MSKHTPTPYIDPGDFATHVLDSQGRCIADFPCPTGMEYAEAAANKEFFIKAANSYEAMRAALLPFAEQPVSEDLRCHAGIVPMRECGRCSKILAARAALRDLGGTP